MYAVVWVGMWYGLSSKKEGQAVTKTILFVLVLPVLCCVLFCYGFPFVIGIPIMLLVTSSGNLRREFRKIAGQRYTVQTDPSWVPQAAHQNQAPPRL
jgi:hypothetical protein